LKRASQFGLTVVFTDLERLSDDGMKQAANLWDALANCPHDVRLLNNPRTPKRRVAVLELLQREGVNEFGVYPIANGDVPEPRSFPVFVREANDHEGPLSDLIDDQESLERWVADARAADRMPPAPIVTEFVQTTDPDGRFRKYGAFRIGDVIVPAHIHTSDGWSVKIGNSEPDAALLAEEWDYVHANPHQEQVMRAFQLSETEYGRIDYALRDGRIQVFEINSNPTILEPGASKNAARLRRKEYVGRRIHQAFVALGDGR